MDVRKLDVEGLARGLKGHLPDDLIDILKSHRITGLRFMNLKESSLKLFNFDLAHILDITVLIEELKSGTKTLTIPEEEVYSDSMSKDNSKTKSGDKGLSNETSIDKQSSGCEDKQDSESESESEEELDAEKVAAETTLKKYVSADYLNTLSRYELKGLRGKCLNWNRLQREGLASTSHPVLALAPEHLLIKPKGKKDGPCKLTKQSSKGNKSSDKENNGTENESASRKSSRLLKLAQKPNNKRDRQLLNDSSDLTENDDTEKASSTGNVNQLYETNEECSQTDDSDKETSGDEDKDSIEEMRYKLKTLPPLAKEDIIKVKPQLPTFDVVSILKKYSNTKPYLSHLEEGYLFIEKIRKLIIRTLVRHLCYKHFDHPRQVNKLHKEGLAKSFVVAFPQFQKLIQVDNREPWSHITGNVLNVVKRIMTALPEDERPRKGKTLKNKKKKFKISKTVNPKVLALLNPSDRSNRDEIFHGMKQTFPNREKERSENKSITELLVLWPQFNNFQGEIISLEFSLMKPDAKDMAVMMTSLVPKVLANWSDVRVKPKCKDDTMHALLLLASKLPHSIAKNTTAIPQEREILELLQTGNVVEEFVVEKRATTKTAVQPYLIGVTSTLTKEVLKYFLVLDNKAMELGAVPLIRAIDLLFKSYVVFNVHYPKTWRMFFRFLQTCFYKVFFGAKDDVPPSCQQIFAQLMSW